MPKPVKTLREKLDEIVLNADYWYINGCVVKPLSWEMNGEQVVMKCIRDSGAEKVVKFETADYEFIFVDENRKGALMANQASIWEKNEVNFKPLRISLLEDLEKIREGKMDGNQAKSISNHVGAIAKIARLELEFIKTADRYGRK